MQPLNKSTSCISNMSLVTYVELFHKPTNILKMPLAIQFYDQHYNINENVLGTVCTIILTKSASGVKP